MPTISKKELDQYNKKDGVYSTLRKPNQQPLQRFTNLNVVATELIKRAFMEYAKAHGCKPNMLQIEWERFNRHLQKYI